MKIQKIITSLAILGILVMPVAALEADVWSTPAIGGIPNIPTFVGKVLTVIWQIFVGLSIIMILVAGILFLTAQGDPGKLTTARQALIWGVIGILVGILAFSITLVIRTGVGV